MRKAFTMMELLVTMTIISVIVVMSVVFIGDYVTRAKLAAARQTVAVLNESINEYRTMGGMERSHSLGVAVAGATKNASTVTSAVILAMRTGFTNFGQHLNFIKESQKIDTTNVASTGSGSKFHFFVDTAGISTPSTETPLTEVQPTLAVVAADVTYGAASTITVTISGITSGALDGQTTVELTLLSSTGTTVLPTQSLAISGDSVSTTTSAALAVGDYTVEASLARCTPALGSTVYLAALGSDILTISKASVTPTVVVDAASMVYGGTAPTLKAVVSVANGEVSAITSGTFTINSVTYEATVSNGWATLASSSATLWATNAAALSKGTYTISFSTTAASGENYDYTVSVAGTNTLNVFLATKTLIYSATLIHGCKYNSAKDLLCFSYGTYFDGGLGYVKTMTTSGGSVTTKGPKYNAAGGIATVGDYVFSSWYGQVHRTLISSASETGAPINWGSTGDDGHGRLCTDGTNVFFIYNAGVAKILPSAFGCTSSCTSYYTSLFITQTNITGITYAAGNGFYLCSSDGYIRQYTTAGVLSATYSGFGNVVDIDYNTSDGYLYYVSSTGMLYRMSTSGTGIMALTSGFSSPTSVSCKSSSEVFVSGSAGVYKVSL